MHSQEAGIRNSLRNTLLPNAPPVTNFGDTLGDRLLLGTAEDGTFLRSTLDLLG
jgi:hypothetical protein